MIWKKSDKLDICYGSPKKRAKEENKMSNSILVSGNVASEIKVSATKDGKKYAHFSMAVNKSNDQNETGNASFFNVSVFDGRSVSDLERFAKKGTPVAVVGYLSSDEGKDGLTYYRVNANSVTLVPGGDDKAAGFFVGTVARLFPTGFSFALNYGSKENPKTIFMFASFSKKLLKNLDRTIYQVGDLIAVSGYLSVYKTTKEDGKAFNNLGIVIAAAPVIIKKKGQQPVQANQQPVAQQMYQQPTAQPQVQQMAQAYQPQAQAPVQQPMQQGYQPQVQVPAQQMQQQAYQPQAQAPVQQPMQQGYQPQVQVPAQQMQQQAYQPQVQAQPQYQQPVQQQTYQPQVQMNMQQPYQQPVAQQMYQQPTAQPQVQQMAQAYQPQPQASVQQPVADQMSEAQFNAITGGTSGDYYVNNFDITSDDLPF